MDIVLDCAKVSVRIEALVPLPPTENTKAGPKECLKDVALKVLQNKVSTVPIIHSSPEDGSIPQLLHLASLSGILKCICRHFKHSAGSLPILQLSIGSIPLANVSSIPIVDDNDSLLDIYSRSDITTLAKDKAYARISLDEISIHQALLLGQDANAPFGLYNGHRCHMCLRSDSLHKVMERLASPGITLLINKLKHSPLS
ncbi:sucrose nonfermenting protein [Trifolium repens]|nr:sucrose nonfermenting protein [Trifolium repens]